jgi:CheY-like chemotaxis protein
MEPVPKRILVVDDEPDFAMLMSMTLEQTGRYETRQESDSTRALAAAREFRPDLVLLDVMMPGLDGGDVVAQFRADPLLREVPVIFLTALVGGEDTKSDATPRAGQCYLGKPVDFDRLSTTIEDLLATPDGGGDGRPS